MTSKFSISVLHIYLLYFFTSSNNNEDNPLSLSKLNILCCLPLRISASIRIVLQSIILNDAAKLAEIKLFPSPGIELVIRITFFSLPTNVNSRFVLKVLIASLT